MSLVLIINRQSHMGFRLVPTSGRCSAVWDIRARRVSKKEKKEKKQQL